jgi:acyl-CoA thioesterase FadM
MQELLTTLPRHAFSPRDAARAGDVWRAFQEVAVEASTELGWPPPRYRAEGTAFLVRSMAVVHDVEALYGERLRAWTWVSRMRREMFLTREIRLTSARGPIARASQEWVHIAATLTPSRAPAALLSLFSAETHAELGEVTLPSITRPFESSRTHVFEFRAWHTWMDPLAHVNHPAYVDFCDEAISVAMSSHGIAPLRLVPVAEEVTFKSGVVAGDDVRVETRLSGLTAAGDAVFDQRMKVGDRICALATTTRRLLDEPGESELARLAG